MAYGIGDKALNKAGRIFIVEAIQDKDFGSGPAPYLIMKPCFKYDFTEDFRLFVPMSNAQNILIPLMTRHQANALIDEIPNLEPYPEASPRERKMQCQNVISTGDRRMALRIIKSLVIYRQKRQEAKKAFSDFDSRLLDSMVTMLDDEIAVVFDISATDARSYLENKIGMAI